MPARLRILLLAALLAGCGEAQGPEIQIPSTPPATPPGTLRVVFSLTGSTASPPAAAGAGRIEFEFTGTHVVLEAAVGDTHRALMERIAREFMADGWTLHLEPGDSPRMFLHLAPGTTKFDVHVQSSVPGAGATWVLQ